MKITYRPDIDGLRAIAVLGVLFYHLDHRICPGGFTGVDIFFVISGYLITSIISWEIQNQSFSLSRFYERRIRRILPAYFFLLLFTTTCAYLLLTPDAMEQYGRTMSNSLIFISNFLFAEKIDYFAKTFTSSPLLHTWSLAVEEQFYLIWPLAMGLLGKILFHQRFKAFLLIFLGGSLLISEILASSHPKLSFFMIYSRAWELGTGALIALPVLPAISSIKRVELLSKTGLFLIVTSLLVINNSVKFPGFSATFAVVGTALIIYSGKFSHRGYVHRLLCYKPLVFTGLISYSLYLWHWPVITFAKYYYDRQLLLKETIVVGLASMLLAYFSYKYIETPFRRKGPHKRNNDKKRNDDVTPASHSRRKIFLGASLATLLLLSVSVTIQTSKGLPSRFADLQQPNLYTTNSLRDTCHLSGPATDLPSSEKCGRNFGKKQALLWGDSHADHYMPALETWAEKNEIHLRQISKSACAPIIGDFDIYRLSHDSYTRYEECKTVNEKVVQLLHDDRIEIVILAGRWSHFFKTELPRRPGQYLLGPQRETPGQEATERIFKENFSHMISTFQKNGVETIILGQVPVFPKNPAECYLKEETPIKQLLPKSTSLIPNDCTLPFQTIGMELNRSREFFGTLSRKEQISFFDPVPNLCNSDMCEALQEGKILYHDTHHLNIEGARFFGPIFMDAINTVSP